MNKQTNFEIIWIEGGILPSMTANFLERISKSDITGGIDIFIGQIRADLKSDKKVKAIQYTSHPKMANKILEEITQNAISTHQLTHVYICHSLGDVLVGGVSMLVIAAAAHRAEAFAGCREMVEKIKSEAPIWGEEIFENDEREWKINN
jgi:molybdopterin synthase catalytic subunit